MATGEAAVQMLELSTPVLRLWPSVLAQAISGIRPAIAQTTAQLGIDLSTITSRATLADALAKAVRLLDTDLPAHEAVRARSAP